MLDLDVKVAVDGKVYRVGDVMDVDQADLPNEFAAQAALYAYFAVLAAEAEAAYDKAVDERKDMEAAAYMYYKNDTDSIPSGSRSVSDGTADKLVQTDEEVQEAYDYELASKRDWKILRAMADSLKMRADMLQSIGAHLRHEYDMTGMVTRERRDSTADDLREHIRNRK